MNEKQKLFEEILADIATCCDHIVTMNEMLGKDAGHFFIKEMSRSIGDEYYSTMGDMGVDLSLMQLEYEVSEMEKRLLKTQKID